MKKLKSVIIITSLVLSSSNLLAGGFEGDKRSEVNLDGWVCEYCPENEKWEFQLDTHLGVIDDEFYNFGNYSGIDNDVQVYFSGDLNMQQEDGRFWKTEFQNVGLESFGIQSVYGKQGSYAVEFDFQSIPVRKYDRLKTPFITPGSDILLLPANWNRSSNAADFSSNDQFTSFSLGTDWDIFKLGLNIQDDNNFEYSTSYRRLEKAGIRESSAASFFSATFLPFAVDQTTEDFSASINYTAQKWFASLTFQLSKFDNELDSVTFVSPFSPLTAGSGVGTMSTAPGNTSTKLSFNGRYNYMERSFVKLRYSRGELIQDDAFLPFTTNRNLLAPLPQIDLQGEVGTENVTVQIYHWFSPKLSFKGKYRYQGRDNKSDQLLFNTITTDAFIGTPVINLPYDFEKETGSAQLNYRLYEKRTLSFLLKSEKKTRNFQAISKTSEDGYVARYWAMPFENFSLTINAEQFSRNNSPLQVLDFLGVGENPLMRRFNVADRDQDKLSMQIFYSFMDNLNAVFSSQYVQQDYKKTEIGLTSNQSNNWNLDLDWQFNKTMGASIFLQKEKIKTKLSGSSTFSTANWFVDNSDEVESYGLNLAFRELLDNDLDLTVSLNQSDADTSILINQNTGIAQLPSVSSRWSSMEFNLNYQYSKQLNFVLSYQYQDFESSDFAIDGVVPGTVNSLLTFGAFSNNYDVNYVVLSIGYKL